MMKQEFEQRTGFEPTAKEYEAIEEVYMNSELDKDAFCKAWVKMNSKRVAKQKAERKAKERLTNRLYKNLSEGILVITEWRGDKVIFSYGDSIEWLGFNHGEEVEKEIPAIIADMKVGESRTFYPICPSYERDWDKYIEINLYERN